MTYLENQLMHQDKFFALHNTTLNVGTYDLEPSQGIHKSPRSSMTEMIAKKTSLPGSGVANGKVMGS